MRLGTRRSPVTATIGELTYTLRVDTQHASVAPTGFLVIDSAIGAGSGLRPWDFLPGGTTFRSASGAGWNCAQALLAGVRGVECLRGEALAAGAGSSVEIGGVSGSFPSTTRRLHDAAISASSSGVLCWQITFHQTSGPGRRGVSPDGRSPIKSACVIRAPVGAEAPPTVCFAITGRFALMAPTDSRLFAAR
ncbi:MAG: hypothetical protein ACT4QA_21400 [Panacagrimonas sp.]